MNCGSICSADFNQGQVVDLTATADAGSVFTGWSGGCSGRGATCTLTMNADTAVTATFAKRARLTIRRVGAGSVTSRPPGINCGRRCSFAFAPGAVELTAKPGVGWRFARWQEACRGGKRICHLTLTTAATATAVFTKKRKAKT